MPAGRGVFALIGFLVLACSESGEDSPLGASGSGGGASGASSVASGGAAAGGGGMLVTAGASGTSAEAGTPGVGGSSAAGSGGSAGAAPGPTCAELFASADPESAYVSFGDDGRLSFEPFDAQGNRIIDFSHAGYRGGGVALPDVPVALTLAPSGADDTEAIQQAIDTVSAAAPGALLLEAGTFSVSGTVVISTSGVVLRGRGSGDGGTRIELTGAPHRFLEAHGSGSWQSEGDTVRIIDVYVPSGATSFNVEDATGFAVGDSVLVDRPVTEAWVHFMGMDTLVRNDAPQTWLSTSTILHADRTIASIAGNEITLDVPLTDSYDAAYLEPQGSSLTRYSFAGRISEVGVENLRVVAPQSATPISEPQFEVLDLSAVIDAWVKDVAAEETVNSVHVRATAKRITIEDFVFTRGPAADGSAGYPLEITLEGTQILVQRASISGDNIYTFATGGRVTGPNAFVNCSGSGAHNRAEPHMRWATGLLADNVVEDDQINFFNRKTAGSGHGWAIGFGVVWNGEAKSLSIEQPPGSQNLCIGCIGTQAATDVPGLFESLGAHVTPGSLYLAQLCDRLGPEALQAIGY